MAGDLQNRGRRKLRQFEMNVQTVVLQRRVEELRERSLPAEPYLQRTGCVPAAQLAHHLQRRAKTDPSGGTRIGVAETFSGDVGQQPAGDDAVIPERAFQLLAGLFATTQMQ